MKTWRTRVGAHTRATALLATLAVAAVGLVGCRAPWQHDREVVTTPIRVDAFVDAGHEPVTAEDDALASLTPGRGTITVLHSMEVACDADSPSDWLQYPPNGYDLDGAARSLHIRVAPTVYCHDAKLLKKILTESTTTTAWVRLIAALAMRNDGVAIDFALTAKSADAELLRGRLTQFVSKVDQVLAHTGKDLTTVVIPQLRGDDKTSPSELYDMPGLPGRLFVEAWRHDLVQTSAKLVTNSDGPLPLTSRQDVDQALVQVEAAGRRSDTTLGLLPMAIDWEGTQAETRPVSFLDDRGRGNVTPGTNGDATVNRFTDRAGRAHTAYYLDGADARALAIDAIHGDALHAGCNAFGFAGVGNEVKGFWKALETVS